MRSLSQWEVVAIPMINPTLHASVSALLELSNLHEVYSFTSVGTNEQTAENKYLVEMEAWAHVFPNIFQLYATFFFVVPIP